MTVYAGYRGGLHVLQSRWVSTEGAPGGGRDTSCRVKSNTALTGKDGSADHRILLDGLDVECLAVHPGAPTRVFAGTFDAGLYRSVDGGTSMHRIGVDDIGPASVTAVAVSDHDPEEVWVGTEPSRVFRSTDAGETFDRLRGLTALPSAAEWSFPPRPHTHHVRWIESCPADPERWYVGIEAGALVITPDAGETWIDRPTESPRDVHTLATHPDDPDRVYAAAGDGYAESDDLGRSWSFPATGLDHGYVWGIAVDPGDPNTVYVSAASGANAAHRRGDSYLYRRRDRSTNATWTRLDDHGIPTGTGTYRAVLAAGSASGEVWALHNGGLYHTRDRGDRFERVDADVPDDAPRALVVIP